MASLVTDPLPHPEGTPPSTKSQPPAKIGVRGHNLFAAFWRWHFYASLLVIPALFVLSLSGLVMLYKVQIDPMFYPGVIVVQVPHDAHRLPLSIQEAAVKTAFPTRTIASLTDGTGGRATIFATNVANGLRNVYVNPYTAKVTGDLAPIDLPSNYASAWHKNFTSTKFGGIAMELAGCWAIVMAISGYYLFFKGWKSRRKRRQRKARGARLTTTHAWVGVVAGLGILFMIVSGLPWTQVWGSNVQSLAAGHGLSLWGNDPGATSTLGKTLARTDGTTNSPGWAISQDTVPKSAVGANGQVSVDVAAAAAAAAGIPQPYFIAFPEGKTGVYSVLGDQWHDSANPAYTDVSKEAAAHVDQYSGKVISTYDYNDYSPVAQAVSQGIAIHEGRRFGPLTQAASTAFCLGVLFLCISAPIMWWRRRKGQKGIAAPKGRMPVYSSGGFAVVLAVLAVALPVFGISLLIILLLDALVIRRVPALRRILNTD